MPAHLYVTLHPPMPTFMSQKIIEFIQAEADKFELRCWVDPVPLLEDGTAKIMVDLPQVWTERAPTAKEVAMLDQLREDGQMEKFRMIVQQGLPPAMR